MPEAVRKLRIFVSSSADVKAERDALAGVIDELNVTICPPFGAVLELVRWETHATPGMGRRQALINAQLGPYDVFVGIMWWRADPGTEEEFRRAITAWEQGGSVRILLYFCKQGFATDSPDEAGQYAKVVSFRKEMDAKGLAFPYPSADAFAGVVRPHLVRVVMDLLGEEGAAVAAGHEPGRARDLIAQEVLADLAALDARIGLALAATEPDPFDERMQKTREAVAPSAADAALTGYRRLMAEQRITSLRQALNGTPLRTEFGTPLIQMLADTAVDIQPVRFFYDQLAEVQWATDSLISALGSVAREDGEAAESRALADARVSLALDMLANRSERAHLAGLQLLAAVDAPADEVERRLAELGRLRPRTLVPAEEIRARLEANVERQEALMERRRALVDEATRLRDARLGQFEALDKRLEIRPTATWSEVVGKAVSLRRLGRTAEAVAAFDRCGQMFAPSDPSAAGHARVAQAFTLAMAGLGVQGGVYLYQVAERSAARAAGLAVGDIIIEYNARTIQGMQEMMEELARTRQGNYVPVSYLRYDPDSGRFARGAMSVEGGPLGAGMMPI